MRVPVHHEELVRHHPRPRLGRSGYSAAEILPTNQGAAYLLAEGGLPRLVKAAYLSDKDIYSIADYAAWIRRPSGISFPGDSRANWDMAA